MIKSYDLVYKIFATFKKDELLQLHTTPLSFWQTNLSKRQITAVFILVGHSRDVSLPDIKRIFVMQRSYMSGPYKILVVTMWFITLKSSV